MTTQWQSVLTTTAHVDGSNVNEYVLHELLGKGTFAKVKRCERCVDGTEPRPFAMKILSKAALSKMKEYVRDGTSMRAVTALDKVEQEISTLSCLYHRNIVLLFEVINDPSNDKIWMVLELMQGPCMLWNSEDKVFHSPITNGVLTEEVARTHVLDIIHGVEYLHGLGICHRDIKPDNILLNQDNRCHLSDFGCAQKYNENAMVTDTAGTFEFLAPECCKGIAYDPFKVDLWAIGVTLYVFLFGKLPFEAENTKELFDCIVEKPLVLPESPVISDDAQDLLHCLLEKDPNQRITLSMLEYHPWLLSLLPEPLMF
ncbi:ser/thr kinase [Thraustotheca clavata]|uniref:Ser/thr kinase n=1 Tax=Thraustotheca clavata TaxID=74557 RepID=A0A1V9Z437_9STRA|nr:ser/thr kinase [Thraustotheca clavata]